MRTRGLTDVHMLVCNASIRAWGSAVVGTNYDVQSCSSPRNRLLVHCNFGPRCNAERRGREIFAIPPIGPRQQLLRRKAILGFEHPGVRAPPEMVVDPGIILDPLDCVELFEPGARHSCAECRPTLSGSSRRRLDHRCDVHDRRHARSRGTRRHCCGLRRTARGRNE